MRQRKCFWRRRSRRTKIVYIILAIAIAFLTTDAIPYAILDRGTHTNYYLDTGIAPDVAHDFHGVHGGFDDTARWFVDDYRSPLVNVDHGLRVTTRQPNVYNHTLGLFGNSTMFGYMLADDDTIASQLQRLLPDTRVLNYGMIGGGILQEEEQLETSQLVTGDTALFYDGVTDVAAVYQRYPLCTVAWGIIALVCNNADSRYVDASAVTAVLHLLTTYYDKAKQYCRDHGIRFIHIAQPIIDSMPIRDDEKLLVQKFIDNGLLAYFQFSSRVYWLIFVADPTALDFTHILDATRASGERVYIDPTHLNAAGNAVIARALDGRIEAW